MACSCAHAHRLWTQAVEPDKFVDSLHRKNSRTSNVVNDRRPSRPRNEQSRAQTSDTAANDDSVNELRITTTRQFAMFVHKRSREQDYLAPGVPLLQLPEGRADVLQRNRRRNWYFQVTGGD